jgi:hypothetical protein
MATRKIKSKSGVLLGVKVVRPYSAARKAKAAQTRKHNINSGVKRRKK